MKTFAIVVLVLCAIGMIPGALLLGIGTSYSMIVGAILIGPGLLSILLCCVVIALADIRSSLKARV